MKKIYIAYKFNGSDPIELRKKLEELSKIVEETLKCKTFIFFRDAQKWGKIKMPIKEVVEKAYKAVEKCDAILVEASEKARGTYFEVGYAKALKKKIIIIHQEGTEADFLEACADKVIVYKDFEDLREKLKAIS
ncbi:MAG: nucleoside 2-deoxyribosyltransferase [Candidatus Nanoarchaeia archaeon]|nr:nucleoside 2-deoxyribosyltransferase [Candidatus Nanoarchaeia archaeon]MDD5741507.1 nucleoside 2-deoxyribosyltransferase [Candidatus Nanoarchaeia archaeon]